MSPYMIGKLLEKLNENEKEHCSNARTGSYFEPVPYKERQQNDFNRFRPSPQYARVSSSILEQLKAAHVPLCQLIIDITDESSYQVSYSFYYVDAIQYHTKGHTRNVPSRDIF
jgi:hypothetical protein